MSAHIGDYEAAIEVEKGDPIDKKIRKAFLFAMGFNNAAAKKPSDIGFNEALNAMKMQAENLKQDRLTLWKELSVEINTPLQEIETLRGASGANVASAFLKWMSNHKDKLNKITKLQINNRRLETLPPEISLLTQLRELSLLSNIRKLPNTIGNLKHLRKIKLTSPLHHFPLSVCELENLEELYVSNCPLESLPKDMGKFIQKLRKCEGFPTHI